MSTFDRPLDECPYVLHQAGVIDRHAGESRQQSEAVCKLLLKRDLGLFWDTSPAL